MSMYAVPPSAFKQNHAKIEPNSVVSGNYNRGRFLSDAYEFWRVVVIIALVDRLCRRVNQMFDERNKSLPSGRKLGPSQYFLLCDAMNCCRGTAARLEEICVYIYDR